MRKGLALAGLLVAGSLFAWGPHPDITQNAVAAIGPDAPLARALGPETAQLRSTCWVPDLWMEWSGAYYYDDYLFSPERPTHLQTSHAFLCESGKYGAHSKVLFRHYFRRALQALRTENAQNAARWVGALLHFTEDTGAPPHAILEHGPLHGPMENWVNGKQISIAGYVPRVLGSDDASAFEAYWANQERLNAETVEIANRIKPLVAAGDRAAAEPLILACANASARNAADLCATLGALLAAAPGGGVLQGRVTGETVPGPLGVLPAKVMLAGTSYSTLADAQGVYRFRNLPPGAYRLLAVRPGSELFEGPVTISGAETVCDLALPPARAPGNLLRNPAFALRWTSPDHRDMWYRRGRDRGWRTEAVPVRPGQVCRVQVEWKRPGAEAVLRFATHAREGKALAEHALGHPESRLEAVAPDKATHAVIEVKGCAGLPDAELAYVALTVEK
ncbi:MAG: carboxypeptidase regulatory-like domain-containing protein [Kiritimatiellia bacterium]|nr:carboxypeptidase regulatory-like domain-containing protein [Kiritimatiellia bacterium]